MSDAKCKQASCTIVEGYQGEEDEDEDTADDERVGGKLSIQQVLEGMTLEFNKSMAAEPPTEKAPPVVADADADADAEAEVADDAGSPQPVQRAEVEVRAEDAANSPEEDAREAEDALVDGESEAPAKKEGNIPRIVLTFRAIDENTDHGKKTKISSCSSNLSLVPDELANCDQIGGVSVKIESSEENLENLDKEKRERVLLEVEPEKAEEVEAPKKEEEVKKDEGNNGVGGDSSDSKDVKVVEGSAPVARKRRAGRIRLRRNR